VSPAGRNNLDETVARAQLQEFLLFTYNRGTCRGPDKVSEKNRHAVHHAKGLKSNIRLWEGGDQLKFKPEARIVNSFQREHNEGVQRPSAGWRSSRASRNSPCRCLCVQP